MKIKKGKKWWGFDTYGMNTKVRPQDNFFKHANGGWIKNNPIPDDESRWGAFLELRKTTDIQIKAILTEVYKKKRAKSGSEEQIIRDFYHSGMDMKERNRLDHTPLEPLRVLIEKIDSKESLVKTIAILTKKGITTPWDVDVDQDLKRTTKNIFYIGQDGLGMPDRDYYIKTDKDTVKTRAAYRKHIKNTLVLADYSRKEAVRREAIIFAIEERLAKASMTKVDKRDPDKIYNKFKKAELQKLTPRIDWEVYLETVGAPSATSMIVEQPLFLKEVNKMIHSYSLDDWKVYLEWHVINEVAPYLSEPFIEETFAFYGKVLAGDKKMKPLWRRVAKTVEGSVGEALGKLYVKKHFGEEAKHKMNELIDDLFVAFKVRISKLDWMSEPTKKKAYQKLRTMNRKIGYPDKWKSYRGLKISPDDYVSNVLAASEFEHKRSMKKLGKPIDPHEWHMYPQTVNAYYSMIRNEIVFPAAILQYPFFDKDADAAINYGAIGYVIGHEMTHGFDDQGSKFDHQGNLKNWWTAADRKKFDAKAKVLEKQFNQYTVAPGVHVNGKLTLGENIADLGGVAIAYDAYQEYLDEHGRREVDSYTPEQRFFFGLAQSDREHSRKEYLKTIVNIDPHSPSEPRVNGPVSNLETFYQAFSVKPGDKLYRAPKNRAKIW